jgi:hypothetical protein
MRRLLMVLAVASATVAMAAGEKTGGACDRSRLPGLWTSTDYSMRIAPDLTYEAAGAPNVMTIDVRGKLAVESCTVRFTDTDGSFACQATQVGTYTFRIGAGTLQFHLVKDDCEGRRLAVNDTRLRRTGKE